MAADLPQLWPTSASVSSIIVDLINVIQIMNTKWSVEREGTGPVLWVTILNG